SVHTSPGPAGSGTLIASLTTQSFAGVPGNGLQQIRLLSTTNALVDILGQSGLSGAQTIPISGNPVSVNFVVHFTPRGTFSTVRFVAVDLCGDWSSFVGAGPSVTR